MRLKIIIVALIGVAMLMTTISAQVTTIPIGIIESDGVAFGPQLERMVKKYLDGYHYYINYRDQPFIANEQPYKIELHVRRFSDKFDLGTGGLDPSEMLELMQELYDEGVRAFVITILSVFYDQAVQEWAESQPETPIILDPSGSNIPNAKDKGSFNHNFHSPFYEYKFCSLHTQTDETGTLCQVSDC